MGLLTSNLLPILITLILFICVAMMYNEGLWSNAIRLINVVTAALLATNFFEPLAKELDNWAPKLTFLWDFVVLWGLFAAVVAVLRTFTDQVSRVKVRFPERVDQIGGSFFALWVGWVMVCFMMMTLHTAPLARNFLFKDFQPEQRMIVGLAPDRQWLGFMQKMSLGTFCRSASREEWRKQECVFDPHAEFLPKYTARRVLLEANVAQHDSICLP
jgi:uncharacterized membrane protein required for colicin V production